MKTRLSFKESVLVASMLFGLFFGAGNLIFPVSMGQQAGSQVWQAAIGFCVTGVGLPLLGILSMGISESRSLFHMSSHVGKWFAYFFTCALYLTIGPFFAIPRTATVSFQVGVAPQLPEAQLPLALCLFSFAFFAVVLFFSLKPSGILTWVGKILNPLFLLFLGTLIVVSLISPMGSLREAAPTGGYAANSFFTGFLEGYNTMDALASLAFGIVLIEVIQKLGITSPAKISLSTAKSGILSTVLMAAIYISLSVIGAQSAKLLGVSVDGGTALYLIAKHYFGAVGGIFLGVTITFACVKTAIGLVTACSTAFSEMFPRISYKLCTIVFSVFAFAVSNVGLSKIISFSLPVLMFLYPLTMVLILLCLIGKLFHHEKKVYLCTMILTILAAVPDFILSLPNEVQGLLPFSAPLKSFWSSFPFAGIGMGWILPAVIGFAVGLSWYLLSRLRRT